MPVRRILSYCRLVLREGTPPLWKGLGAVTVLLPVSVVGVLTWFATSDVLLGIFGGCVALLGVGVIGSYRAWSKADRAAARAVGLSVSLGRLKLLDPKPETGATGSLLVISSARITNRSPKDRVSLGIGLSVELFENGHFQVEHKWYRAWHEVEPQALPTPLQIEPQKTEAGLLGFWVSPGWLNLIGPELRRPFEEGDADPSASIHVEDFVSGKSITVRVPGSYN